MQQKQKTVTRDKQETELRARGRHDPCVVPRGKFSGSYNWLLFVLSLDRETVLDFEDEKTCYTNSINGDPTIIVRAIQSSHHIFCSLR